MLRMPDPELVYLDYAATSAVRPAVVTAAVTSYLENVGATPGRGGHRLAIEAGRVALRCRQKLVQLLGLPGDPGRIAFMYNATHALNTALHGVLRAGDIVVTTAYDHNAVRRPIHALQRTRGVVVRHVNGDAEGGIDLAEVRAALTGARLLVINAASNVLGTALDVTALSGLARDAGALSLVDAAQSAGHMPFNAAAAGVDMLAFTGHKGLLGPQGIGGLWIREGVLVEPLLRGGTGGDSRLPDMPEAYPDHLEAGTSNAPAIAGLAAGLDWLLAETVEKLHARTARLKTQLHAGLAAITGIRVLSPPAPDGVPIVTFLAEPIDAGALAARLDQEHGVLARSGLHCAPDAHALLGTQQTGAVRFSLGWASTGEHVERALRAVASVIGARDALISQRPVASR
jgi:cysteine desulfurase family protein